LTEAEIKILSTDEKRRFLGIQGIFGGKLTGTTPAALTVISRDLLIHRQRGKNYL
jgi:hypothetical protein